MCDVAYVLMLERFDAVTANASNLVGSGADAPGLIDPQLLLDELLSAEPSQVDPERRELMNALGLARG